MSTSLLMSHPFLRPRRILAFFFGGRYEGELMTELVQCNWVAEGGGGNRDMISEGVAKDFLHVLGSPGQGDYAATGLTECAWRRTSASTCHIWRVF